MLDIIYSIISTEGRVAKDFSAKDFEVSEEGIVTAVVADVGHGIHSAGTRIKGWFEGLTKKRQHINEVCTNTIDWLKEADRDNRNLNLDMGSFKTWMKTSETYFYRYYYILNDSIYNKIISSLKSNNATELEDFINNFVNQVNASQTLMSTDMKDRKTATKLLDNIKTIKDLIIIVEKYRARVNNVFELMEKQQRIIKGFPFQLMLSGAADLRQTVKKIVNLAI